MKMIVGLGNPGLTYKNTRHNIGFMFVDAIAKYNKIEFKLNKSLKGSICKYKYNDVDVLLVKPMTFMNLSGECVNLVSKYYNINDEDIIVVHDDLDLPTGKIRIRSNGSSGGQKGMGNIIDILRTNEIKRIRIGIDKNNNVIDYVLGKFLKNEREIIDKVLCIAPQMIEDYLDDTFSNFMNKYNKNGNE